MSNIRLDRCTILLMSITTFLSTAPAWSRAEDAVIPQNDPRLQKLFQDEANRWEMWVGPDQQRKAEIVTEPVFRWQNPSRANGQSGAMYVWVYEGRPVAIGGVFSNPSGKNQRDIMHEFHALGPDRLFPEFRNSKSKWLPEAGVTLFPLPDSPKVEVTQGKRTLQLRAISRDFTANSMDKEKVRWELRLLPKPLFRYEKPQGDIIDGALLAFVSDAGTDPEIILVLEARKNDKGGTAWFYRTVRLSISDLYVDYKGTKVWTSLHDDPNGAFGNKDNTYGLIWDRAIDELPPATKKPLD
jgi:hypothetical protein